MNIKSLIFAASMTLAGMIGSAQAQSNDTYGFNSISIRQPASQTDQEALKLLTPIWAYTKSENDYPYPYFYYSAFQINGENYIVSALDKDMQNCQPTENNSTDKEPIICNGRLSKFSAGKWQSKQLPSLCLLPSTNGDITEIVTSVSINTSTQTINIINPADTLGECTNTFSYKF